MPVAVRPVSHGPTRDWCQAARGGPDDVGVLHVAVLELDGIGAVLIVGGPQHDSGQGLAAWFETFGLDRVLVTIHDDLEADAQSYLDRISLRRMTSPHDVATMIAFLLSDAGVNISGQSISVDGNVETL